MKMTASWDVAPCSLVERDRHFRGAYFITKVMNRSDDETVCTLETSIYFDYTALHSRKLSSSCYKKVISHCSLF
jgi:hypothetical protein